MKRTNHHLDVLLFDNEEKKQGTIIRKPGSRKLYILFYYFNRRVEKTTGLNDTRKNREKVRLWLDRIIERRDAGKLIFAEAFPGAPEEEKAYFAKLEGWQYAPEPRDIIFGHYIQEWYENVWNHYPEGTKKDDYRLIIDYWLVPYFKEMTFFQISGVELQKFINSMKWKKGAKKGQPLSKARAKNILIPLRTIWNDACDQFRWVLHNPFGNLKKHLPKTPAKRREGFRFGEWLEFLKHVDPWYQPVVELMLLTGMINSEIAGLRKSDIRPDYILVQHTIVRGKEHDTPKTVYRIRKIPITQAVRKRLDILQERSTGELLVTTENGSTFRPSNFLKSVWARAARESRITDKVPYSLRHSFAAWALTLRVDPNRLVRLMGHGSKKMVYEVYGDYIEGLEEDFWLILEYFGRDFVEGKAKQPPHLLAYPGMMVQPGFHQVIIEETRSPVLPLKTF
ncbi:site-specific integrase [Geomobilimonas luticola]|uniref:Site-specific integrase n=1 Tax=Geomobilimonas luticola TaxID=1114878 RepID=A0ABS5SHI6_9BACT|nr:site-specific integrase [Geomobilimonas luticola]MBT0654152.1 site-specific integrase [Geomobilimonas luticola]